MSDKNNCTSDANAKCSCKGYNLDKLLQPNILILLAKESLHGYSIIQALEKKDLFFGEKADNTGIYRTLNKLEERGMIRFEWELENTGPAKKVYHITDEGLECLSNWIDTLESYQKIIEGMTEEAKSILNK